MVRVSYKVRHRRTGFEAVKVTHFPTYREAAEGVAGWNYMAEDWEYLLTGAEPSLDDVSESERFPNTRVVAVLREAHRTTLGETH